MQPDITMDDEDRQIGGDGDNDVPPPPPRRDEDETMETEKTAVKAASVPGHTEEGITTATHGHDKDSDSDYRGKVGNNVENRAEPEF